MLESRGIVFDVRSAGRAIDADLLYELARFGRDSMEHASLVAELSGMGIIHGQAFQQITNNGNFRGGRAPLEERLAFALGVACLSAPHDRGALDFCMGNSDPVSTFHALWRTASSTATFEEWSEPLLENAHSLLVAASDQTLLSSPVCAELLLADLRRLRVPRMGDFAGLAAKGLIAARLGFTNRLPHAEILDLARRTDRGEIDVATLALLAPSAAVHGNLQFLREFGHSAVAPKISFAAAVHIAADVARSDLTYGQIFGFAFRFRRQEREEWMKPDLPETVEIIKAVNRGEIPAGNLARVLNAATYFPPALVRRILSRVFSTNSGNKYLVGGDIALHYTRPLTKRLALDVIEQLAGDDAALTLFGATFQREVGERLPSAIKMWWSRTTKADAKWELELYEEIVDAAFNAAKVAAGVR